MPKSTTHYIIDEESSYYDDYVPEPIVLKTEPSTNDLLRTNVGGSRLS